MAVRLTEEEVHAACAEIAAQGERPTTLVLLKNLGRGSLTTLTKYLNSWNVSDEAQVMRIENLPAVVKLPPELSKEGEDLLKKMWNVAKSLADAELDIQREALKQAETVNQIKLEDAFKFSDAQSMKIDLLEDALTELKAKLAEEQNNGGLTLARFNEAEKSNVGLSKDNDQLHHEVNELKKQVSALEELNKTITQEKSLQFIGFEKLNVLYESAASELKTLKTDLKVARESASDAGKLVSNLEGQLAVYKSLDK